MPRCACRLLEGVCASVSCALARLLLPQHHTACLTQRPEAPLGCTPHPLQAFWALLLDLLACPAPASAVLPPLAAALDVWPSLVAPQPAAAAGGDAAEPAGELASLHGALQHLCTLAAAEPEHAAEAQHEAAAADAPPPLLLERQPVAAAEFLRRQGRQRWGWAAGAAGSGTALLELRAALQRKPEAAAEAPAPAGPAEEEEDAAAAPEAAAAVAGGAAGVEEPAPAEHVMQDGQVEEL